MEALIALVAASFARHGIECPAGGSQLAWGQPPSAVQAERSSAAASGHSNSGISIVQAAPTARPSALPEHNFRRSAQADPIP